MLNQLCKFDGNCKFGTSCRFQHSSGESKAAGVRTPTPISAACRAGNECERVDCSFGHHADRYQRIIDRRKSDYLDIHDK